MSGKWGQVQSSRLVSSRGGQRVPMRSLDKVIFPMPVPHREETPSDGQKSKHCCRRIASQPHPSGGGLCSNAQVPSQNAGKGGGWRTEDQGHQIFLQSLSLHVTTDLLPERRRRRQILQSPILGRDIVSRSLGAYRWPRQWRGTSCCSCCPLYGAGPQPWPWFPPIKQHCVTV